MLTGNIEMPGNASEQPGTDFNLLLSKYSSNPQNDEYKLFGRTQTEGDVHPDDLHNDEQDLKKKKKKKRKKKKNKQGLPQVNQVKLNVVNPNDLYDIQTSITSIDLPIVIRVKMRVFQTIK